MGLDNPQKLPDKQLLIKVLGVFKPEHEIFRKDYLPPIKEMTMAEKVVDNQDNFFSHLPKLYKKRDIKGKSRLADYLMCNEEKKVRKLKDLKNKIEMQIMEMGMKKSKAD